MHGCLSPRHDIAQSVQERVPNPGPEASGGALQEFPPGAIDNIGGSSSGRTADSDSVNRGSNPRPPATHESPRRRESVRTLISSKPAWRHVWRCSAGVQALAVARSACRRHFPAVAVSPSQESRPRFVGDRRTVPRFAFPESAIACRACAIPDFAVAVDRPVCLRAMSAVWHH